MRQSGILMHITSLPSPYGVGTMGKAAYQFIEFLKKAGQQYWQILPVTPTGFGDSPYQSCSTYAGNHYLIDLDLLVEAGLLKKSEITKINWSDTPSRMNFPGTQSSENWTWRAPKGFATAELSKRIYRLTELYGRQEIEETNG